MRGPEAGEGRQSDVTALPVKGSLVFRLQATFPGTIESQLLDSPESSASPTLGTLTQPACSISQVKGLSLFPSRQSSSRSTAF